MLHELKTWPIYFERIIDGSKTFEIRRNDRGFQAGDALRLREYDPLGSHYTGREVLRSIGYVASGELFGLDLGGHVVLSLVVAGAEK